MTHKYAKAIIMIISALFIAFILFEGAVLPALFQFTNSEMLENREKEKKASEIFNTIMEESGFEDYRIEVDYGYDKEYLTNGYQVTVNVIENGQLDYAGFYKTLTEVFLDPLSVDESAFYEPVFLLTYNGQKDAYSLCGGTIHAEEMNASITYDKDSNTYSVNRPLRGMKEEEIESTGYGKPLSVMETEEGKVYHYRPFARDIDYLVQDGVVVSLLSND